MLSGPLTIHGAIITPHSPHSAKFLPHALIHVGHDGIIKWIEEEIADEARLQEVLLSRRVGDLSIRKLKRGEFLIPGFIDTHTHAPQFPNLGRGGQEELLDWLEHFTYPTESKFGDAQYAKNVYSLVVRKLLDCGTTTCCYYGTSHLVGDKVLADVVHSSGQRAFIGKCNMDRNAPEEVLDSSAEESLNITRALISYINSLNTPLVAPIVTPRFAISCTEKLMKGLGDLAAEDLCCSKAANHRHPHHHHDKLPIQTHISENMSEVRLARELFPSHSSYAGIYDDYGLLGPTTILAHGCYLTHEEISLIKRRNAGLSHCPTSNFNLSSGVAKVGEWIDAGVKVGLGTDVSGGFSPSMLVAIRDASKVSKVLAAQAASASPESTSATSMSPSLSSSTPAETLVALADLAPGCLANKPLPIVTLLHIATLGGAQLCNLDEHTGSLAPGKVFDALQVSVRSETGNPSIWWDEDEEHKGHHGEQLEAFLERLFFCGDDRNISAVWVEGKLVGGRQFHV